VPTVRVAGLRRAFDATVRDPAFVADAAKLQLAVDPMSGEQVRALAGDLAHTPADVMARGRGILPGTER
jgi:hypothetical protein